MDRREETGVLDVIVEGVDDLLGLHILKLMLPEIDVLRGQLPKFSDVAVIVSFTRLQ